MIRRFLTILALTLAMPFAVLALVALVGAVAYAATAIVAALVAVSVLAVFGPTSARSHSESLESRQGDPGTRDGQSLVPSPGIAPAASGGPEAGLLATAAAQSRTEGRSSVG